MKPRVNSQVQQPQDINLNQLFKKEVFQESLNSQIVHAGKSADMLIFGNLTAFVIYVCPRD